MNGKIPKPWMEDSEGLKLTDWNQNVIFLPTISGISLLFSILSMIKAVIEFNIIRVHIEVNIKNYNSNDLDKLNLVKLSYGGKVLGSS